MNTSFPRVATACALLLFALAADAAGQSLGWATSAGGPAYWAVRSDLSVVAANRRGVWIRRRSRLKWTTGPPRGYALLGDATHRSSRHRLTAQVGKHIWLAPRSSASSRSTFRSTGIRRWRCRWSALPGEIANQIGGGEKAAEWPARIAS